MKPLRIKTTGLSLLEVRAKYSDCFYKQSWYDKEEFAKDKPEAGEYEFDFENSLKNQIYAEQVSALGFRGDGSEFPHPAVLAEALCIHFKETGERLMTDWWSRTSLLDSDGRRVDVGRFGAVGLGVDHYWVDDRRSYLGVVGARKLDTGSLAPIDPFDSLPLQSLIARVAALEAWKGRVQDELLGS